MEMNNHNTRPACGCARRQNACEPPCRGNCNTIKKELQAVCFALDEVILYLDAYPHDREALCYYHELVAEKTRLVAEYEAACGPVTAYGNTSRDSWDWIKSPWPWTYEANL